MKSKLIWILSGCLILGMIVAALFFAKMSVGNAAKPTTKAFSTNQTSNQSSPASTNASPLGTATNATVTAQQMHDAEVKREQTMFHLWVLTPITFYGKVVDQNGKPIEDAKAAMSAADHPYATGSKYERKTDKDGLFSIDGIHGAALEVTVSKDGYYSLPESWGNFGYASASGNEKPPHTDSRAPAIFVLRKQGQTESLLVYTLSGKISKTGVPISVDLHTGSFHGIVKPDIQIQSWVQDQDIKPGTYRHFDWRCTITVPGGGLQPRTGDQFDFTAPEEGYQPSDEIDISAADPHWSMSQSREYYLQLATGEYARINFAIGAGGYNTFQITSYLNPIKGHRDLEAGPSQTASQ